MDAITKELKKYGQVKQGKPLSRYLTMKIGGPAKYFISINQTKKLVGLLDFLTGEGIGYQIIGGGSNILFDQAGFDGVVIKIETQNIQVLDSEIIVDSGVLLGALVSATAKNSLSGLEWASGIPGTVGGAVRGNAGAYGGAISDSVKKVGVWRDGEVIELEPHECGFEYRSSIFKKNNDVILWVKLFFKKDEPIKITKKMNDLFLERQNKLPTEPSSGSFFKNIKISDWPGKIDKLPKEFVERKMIPAGWLIEQCGLKGYRLGDAGISDKHANFIVNYGSATLDDILAVVEKARAEVYNKYGVNLEPEVEIINN